MYLPKAQPLAYGEKPEMILRNTITTLTGDVKKAVIDLYRYLVIANFSRLEGAGGKTALLRLDLLYPPQRYLPEFDIISGSFNTPGVIAYLLLKHSEQLRESWYQCTGAVLAAMLEKENIWNQPQFDANKINLE